MWNRGASAVSRSLSAPRARAMTPTRSRTPQREESLSRSARNADEKKSIMTLSQVAPLRSVRMVNRTTLHRAMSSTLTGSQRQQRRSQSTPRGRQSLIAAGAAASFMVGAECERRTDSEQIHAAATPDSLLRNGEEDDRIFAWPQQFSISRLFSQDASIQQKDVAIDSWQTQHKAAPPSRFRTIAHLERTMTIHSVEHKYSIDFTEPLGVGAFGSVYMAIDRATGEKVALKQISKKFTDDTSFQREMNALLHLNANGGHPNISGLREHFSDSKHYHLILDLVSGGEMFDHLVSQGAYSEADAARLVGEVASALAFMHGIDVVHGDLKPENLMLTSNTSSDAVIQVVDFGCAEVHTVDSDFKESVEAGSAGRTPAYSPPEAFESGPKKQAQPALDMWAVGVIVYIMLTGVHPFDLDGGATDEEIQRKIINREAPPLRDCKTTEHLSESAIDLIEKLIAWEPEDRITAIQMLDHPWVKGETARTKKIEGGCEKLSKYRKFKSQLESKIFADLVMWAGESQQHSSKKTSLIERSFRSLDKGGRGFLTTTDLHTNLSQPIEEVDNRGSALGKMLGRWAGREERDNSLSLSGFSELIAENMKNKHFQKGCVVYNEGDKGDHMYFINSGTIEVSCENGTKNQRKQGNFFGEGALLHPEGSRSGTIRCVTPVHAIEISREYFEKYLASSENGLFLNLQEKHNTRNRNRAKAILRLQKAAKPVEFTKGQTIYSAGQRGKSMFILEEGLVNVTAGDKVVFHMKPGDICGEHSLLTGKGRNTSAICVSDTCKLKELHRRDFNALMKKAPSLKKNLMDINLRRQFQKALVLKLNKDFPTEKDLKAAFDAANEEKTGHLSIENVRSILHFLDKSITNQEISDVLGSLSLSKTDSVSFEEFKQIFGMDEESAAAL
mmetsp:Transcript_21244/g.38368  ORF Transcript_21244/g.38368 Transcript_21244/m.38368 type:complete len:902 (-) Transcript_21244:118-2823(-)